MQNALANGNVEVISDTQEMVLQLDGLKQLIVMHNDHRDGNVQVRVVTLYPSFGFLLRKLQPFRAWMGIEGKEEEEKKTFITWCLIYNAIHGTNKPIL